MLKSVIYCGDCPCFGDDDGCGLGFSTQLYITVNRKSRTGSETCKLRRIECSDKDSSYYEPNRMNVLLKSLKWDIDPINQIINGDKDINIPINDLIIFTAIYHVRVQSGGSAFLSFNIWGTSRAEMEKTLQDNVDKEATFQELQRHCSQPIVSVIGISFRDIPEFIAEIKEEGMRKIKKGDMENG